MYFIFCFSIFDGNIRIYIDEKINFFFFWVFNIGGIKICCRYVVVSNGVSLEKSEYIKMVFNVIINQIVLM